MTDKRNLSPVTLEAIVQATASTDYADGQLAQALVGGLDSPCDRTDALVFGEALRLYRAWWHRDTAGTAADPAPAGLMYLLANAQGIDMSCLRDWARS